MPLRLSDEAVSDGRDVSAIAAQVTDMILAAADSARAGSNAVVFLKGEAGKTAPVAAVTEDNFFV